MNNCELCGTTENLFPDHYEKHISPPRTLTICKGCHTGIHSRLGFNKKTRGGPTRLIGVRIAPPTFEVLQESTQKGMQTSARELIRAAIRDFLKREYPALWEKHVEKIK